MPKAPQKKSLPDGNELITAKQAATVAAKYLAELVELHSKPMLEEVEMSDDRSKWILTLSYTVSDNPYLVFGGNKDFKAFEIDRKTGEVLSMKIRILK